VQDNSRVLMEMSSRSMHHNYAVLRCYRNRHHHERQRRRLRNGEKDSMTKAISRWESYPHSQLRNGNGGNDLLSSSNSSGSSNSSSSSNSNNEWIGATCRLEMQLPPVPQRRLSSDCNRLLVQDPKLQAELAELDALADQEEKELEQDESQRMHHDLLFNCTSSMSEAEDAAAPPKYPQRRKSSGDLKFVLAETAIDGHAEGSEDEGNPVEDFLTVGQTSER